jgi:poly(A)-specific ribonuclease
LYQEIAELFPGKLKLTSEKQKKGNYIQIKRIQENEEDEEDSTLTKLLQKEVGFSRIIKLFEKYQPALIGHNLFLDVAHIFHKLLKPLPNTLSEFKTELKKSFST